ncbi:hypothetical protein [Spirosoma sp. KUDC1026]|uniref:hypothetical protein n=1 Tax=Spirosoma sp. KUDC1026 TaxID=2745947 RepID=UPI00159BD717|nr:hypothetical protein [Spirosoma sp. KUDC1026]QKZ14988.1 hypothetical protein HU175_21130 [Spirosoma sp. KUDC1026]
MIHVLFDQKGGTYADTIVRVDGGILTGDSYALVDYLGVVPDDDDGYYPAFKDLREMLLQHWIGLFTDDAKEIFMIYDLSDQYIATLYFEAFTFKGRGGYYYVSKKWTKDFTAWSITRDVSHAELSAANWETDDPYYQPRMITRKNILYGLRWSLKNLQINSNEVVI